MKRLLPVAAASLAIALAGCAHAPAGGGDGWVTLFDGSSLDAFEKVGDANWRLEDGLAVADAGSGFLMTKKDYRDFEIRAEFYAADHDTNSGIFIRCEDPAAKPADFGKVCYEVNIWDARPKQDYATGSIVDVASASPVPQAGGRWNTYDITVKGDHFVVVLNGAKTADAHDGKHAQGRIALQRFPGNEKSGHAIKWRKVQVREL